MVDKAKTSRNGDRSNTTGEKHYAAHRKQQLERVSSSFIRKANGLHRLEVALFKWLGNNDGANPAVRAALDQARSAQQDSDFKPLWDLLDERARIAGSSTEEHY